MKRISKLFAFGVLLAGLISGIVAYFPKIESYLEKEHLKALFPEFVSTSYSLTVEDKKSLEAILENKNPPANVAETNVCHFNSFSDFSSGRCTFLSPGWVLLSYHQLGFYQPKKEIIGEGYLLLTSKLDFIHSEDISVVAISPREDLALLKVKPKYDYIGTVGIPDDVPQIQEKLNYVHFPFYPFNNPRIIKVEIPLAEMTISGPFNFAQFSSMIGSWDGKIGEGCSGSPIYQDHYLRGILVRSGTEPGTAMYSSRIRDFLKNCLEKL